MNREEALNAGAELVLLELAGDTPVRLMRVLIYEGPYDKVKHQIAQSLPVGCRQNHRSPDDVVLEVHQGEYEILKPEQGVK